MDTTTKQTTEEKKRAKKVFAVREGISSGLVMIFYGMFFAFAWYGVYQGSLAFYNGTDTGIPGNPQIIAEDLLVPTLQAVAWALGAMTLYAFLFAGPDRGPGWGMGSLARQDLRGVMPGKRAHFWTVPWWLQAVILFCFSYYIRTLVIDLIGRETIQVMDFERVFYMSLEDAPIFADVQGINFYQAFPNWALHVKLLHLLNVNFGGTPLTGITYNAIISSLSVVLLYLVIYFATAKDVLAVLSALIFSCWPFYLFYMILLSPDFSFVFLCLLGLLIIVVTYRFAKPLWLKVPLYGTAGIVLSLASFFKSIDKILIVALFIAAVLSFIAFGRWDKRRAASALLAAVVFFGAWAGTGKLVYREIEQYVGGPVNTDVSPYFLNVGMNLDTYGQWSEEVLNEYLEGIRATDYDFAAVNQSMKESLDLRVQEVKDDMQRRQAEKPGDLEYKWDFFLGKMEKAWANNEGIRFIMQTINPENPLYDMAFYEKYYAEIQGYQVAVALLMALGAAAAFFSRERRGVLICALMVFGFGLLLMLSEVQPRYKAVVFPFMSVVAAYGIYSVLRAVQLLILAAFQTLRERSCKKAKKEV